MTLATIATIHDLVELSVTAVSLLGGAMAFCSGREAYQSVRAQEDPERLSFRINTSVAEGFKLGLPLAVVVATLLAWI